MTFSTEEITEINEFLKTIPVNKTNDCTMLATYIADKFKQYVCRVVSFKDPESKIKEQFRITFIKKGTSIKYTKYTVIFSVGDVYV